MNYLCDRKIPRSNDVVIFAVEAENGVDAKHMAEELAYAVAWHRDAFRGEKPPRPRPSSDDKFFRWASSVTDRNGAKA